MLSHHRQNSNEKVGEFFLLEYDISQNELLNPVREKWPTFSSKHRIFLPLSVTSEKLLFSCSNHYMKSIIFSNSNTALQTKITPKSGILRFVQFFS